MGTMRLVVDAPDGGAPSEVNVERLGELLGDTRNRLWLDIGDPDPPRSPCCTACSASTSWRSRK